MKDVHLFQIIGTSRYLKVSLPIVLLLGLSGCRENVTRNLAPESFSCEQILDPSERALNPGAFTFEQAQQCKNERDIKNQEILNSFDSTTATCANHQSTDGSLAGELLLDQIALMRQTSFIADSSTVYTIPTVVHVIHLGEQVGVGTNISDHQITSAIVNLNERFRRVLGTSGYGNGVDTAIQFALAKRDPSGIPHSGINRVNGSLVANYASSGIRSSGTSGALEVDVKALSRWDHTKYYNIWIVSEIENNDAGVGTQGYAYFPSTNSNHYLKDGTVILFNAFGTVGNLKSYTDENTVITHETGHFFSLYHTFNATSSCTTESDCTQFGDRVCDTPVTTQATSCSSPACSGTQQIQNYMDYTMGSCQDMFTQNQKDRMRDSLLNLRTSLTTSLGATPVNSLDVGIQTVSNVSAYNCGAMTVPNVTIVNVGSSSVSSAVIRFRVDGGAWNETNYSGTLATGQTASLNLSPLPSLSGGNHSIEFNVTNPNSSTDQNISNNTHTIALNVPTVQDPLTVSITFDYFGSENSFDFKDFNGAVLVSDGGFNNNTQGTTYSRQLCLPLGCHSFTMKDAVGDGQSFGSITGSYTVRNGLGQTLASGSGNWGSSVTHESVCVGQSSTPIDTTHPIVSITTPNSGATYTSQVGVTITAVASDASGISKVQFFKDGNLKAEDLTAPFTYGWGFAANNNGANIWTAVAFDGAGNSATSAPVVININIPGGPSPTPDTTPPTVTITSPANNSTLSTSPINITATASDAGGIAKVQFFKGTTLMGEDLSNPYAYSWAATTANNGSNSWKAVAIDLAGNSTTSSIVNIGVNISTTPSIDTQAPTVSLSGIENNSVLSGIGILNLIANATDNVGVSKVEFYDNGVLKGSDSTVPYTYNWAVTNTMNGLHTWTAKAIDAASNSKTSAILSITVTVDGGTNEDTPIDTGATDNSGDRSPSSDGEQLVTVDKIGFCGTIQTLGKNTINRIGPSKLSAPTVRRSASWSSILSWLFPWFIMCIIYRNRIRALTLSKR